MGVPPNGRFMIEHTIKMDDLGVSLFQETSIYKDRYNTSGSLHQAPATPSPLAAPPPRSRDPGDGRRLDLCLKAKMRKGKAIIYIYIYVCVPACTYYVYIYIYIYFFIYLFIFIHLYMCIYTHVYIGKPLTCAHSSPLTCAHPFTCAHAHILSPHLRTHTSPSPQQSNGLHAKSLLKSSSLLPYKAMGNMLNHYSNLPLCPTKQWATC